MKLTEIYQRITENQETVVYVNKSTLSNDDPCLTVTFPSGKEICLFKKNLTKAPSDLKNIYNTLSKRNGKFVLSLDDTKAVLRYSNL